MNDNKGNAKNQDYEEEKGEKIEVQRRALRKWRLENKVE